MRQRFFPAEAWSITETTCRPDLHAFHETVFCLANGYMGVRGTPEEGFSGTGGWPHTYVAAVNDRIPMHPDYHIVRYMPHLTVMVDVANWFPLELWLHGTRFDPREGRLLAYRRRLNLRGGILTRELLWQDARGRTTELAFTRFVSLDNLHLGGVRCHVVPRDWNGPVEIVAALDARHAKNQRQTDAGTIGTDGAFLCCDTLETHIATATVTRLRIQADTATTAEALAPESSDRRIALHLRVAAEPGHPLILEKLAAVCASRDPGAAADPLARARELADRAADSGWDRLLERHRAAWARVWAAHDVRIEGDRAAQQGIRYGVFSMHANYAGTDPRVNIPAKGLTGPGYGGLYWWDTEAYMVPFFLYTAPEKARNLLLFRYHTLDGARRKAREYGYRGAMYPWVTVTGDECSGDWEYGMLEQHVAAAVAHAVRTYVEATRDDAFLWDYGAEMVLETARFWASRVTWSARRGRYVINVITGPDEYAVAVNNNCYTNAMAQANLAYAVAVAGRMRRRQPAAWQALVARLALTEGEVRQWRRIARLMYIPFDRSLGIHEQDDSFLDRDPFFRDRTPADEKPVGRKWSWERLMRSQAMKQADVVLLMLMLNDRFPAAVKLANYRFYEPRTTHESSLSPCVYGILAAELGLMRDAFRYYLHTARLDLDDVNGNTDQGQHTAAIAGSWLAVVNGFGGLRLRGGMLSLAPRLPPRWHRLCFSVLFRGRRVTVDVQKAQTVLRLDGAPLPVRVGRRLLRLTAGTPTVLTGGNG